MAQQKGLRGLGSSPPAWASGGLPVNPGCAEAELRDDAERGALPEAVPTTAWQGTWTIARGSSIRSHITWPLVWGKKAETLLHHPFQLFLVWLGPSFLSLFSFWLPEGLSRHDPGPQQ